MAIFLGTFPRNSTLHPHFVRMDAPTEQSAREVMTLMYGQHWAQVYLSVYLPALERCGLTEVRFGCLQAEVS